jgi:GTP cyclohydrolase II
MTHENIKQAPHIVLTSHPGAHGASPVPVEWGAKTAAKRGPLIATTTNMRHRNVIGTHSGAYSVYRALAIAAGSLDPERKADLTDTSPAVTLPPNDSWMNPKQIVSFDPWGHTVVSSFKKYIEKGYDIRPSIAVTKAHIQMPEVLVEVQKGKIPVDGKVVKENGDVVVTKIAIEPVWYLPGIAERFQCDVGDLRRHLFEKTGGMFPELVTRGDLDVFLPPIGGATVYIFGSVKGISDPSRHLSVRVHDECNGSDVFGSDICTCRPYLVHGIELCIDSAQRGGSGIVVYNRKEGRALGEVTKFLVYNARKRQKGGDLASKYFERTECVAGVQDMRFQQLMSDVLLWLGATNIDRFVSMSNMKYDSLKQAGIKVKERVTIPEEMIPADAHVEMEAKKAHGYYTNDEIQDLRKVKGRGLDE